MPSLAMFQIVPPTDAREFEKIIRDYCNVRYPGYACIFARPGQKQYGVDVVSSGNNGLIAIQCKDYQITNIGKKHINDWIALAEEFNPPINHFIIAIADKTDGEIQRHIFAIDQERRKAGLFSVEVLYWEEISSYIKMNPVMLQQYYPFINTVDSQYTGNLVIGNGNEMRVAFIDLVIRFGVLDFMAEDPFVGIKTDYAIAGDQFDIEIEYLFRKAVLLQETDIYIKILDFISKWNEYRVYLVPYVQPSMDGLFVNINRINKEDYEAIKMIIQIMKDEIYRLYEEVVC